MTTTRAVPDGSIPADQTHVQIINHACDELERLHGLTTIAGSRAREHTKTIRDVAAQMEREHAVTTSLLHEELARQDKEGGNS